MPEYLSPGVYVEEISVLPKPIEGVATSNLGTLGPTERGPTDVRLITSWLEFTRTYGQPIAGSFAAHSVKGFFDNGGRRCFMARIAADDATSGGTMIDGLSINAGGPGAWSDRVLVRVGPASQAGDNGDQFKVTLLYYREGVFNPFPADFVDPTVRGAQSQPGFLAPDVVEVFDNLTARDGAQNEVARALEASNLVWAEWDPLVPRNMPALRTREITLGGRLRVELNVPPTPFEGTYAISVQDAGGGNAADFRLVLIHYPAGLPANFDPAELDHTAQATPPDPGDVSDVDDLAIDLPNNEPVTALEANAPVQGTWLGAGTRPANTPRWIVMHADALFQALAGGADGTPIGLDDYNGEEITQNRNGEERSWGTGLLGIENVDEVSLLMTPDEHQFDGLRNAVINHCERLRDRFALFSVEGGSRNVNSILPDPPTTFAAIYWPWIQTIHPVTNQRLTLPPVGHVAGIVARTDVERGVHKAPANSVVRGALDLEFQVSRGQQDILNPRGVNVIRDFRADRRGIRLWGARTMSADPEWKYVNVRRLFLFLEESIDEGTQWVVFEPNSAPLWDRVRRSIENFLLTVWRNGALMGTSPEEAFYVKCDRSTMTQDDIDNGRLICYIGVAPVKPAEFVIFRIHQWTADAGTAV